MREIERERERERYIEREIERERERSIADVLPMRRIKQGVVNKGCCLALQAAARVLAREAHFSLAFLYSSFFSSP